MSFFTSLFVEHCSLFFWMFLYSSKFISKNKMTIAGNATRRTDVHWAVEGEMQAWYWRSCAAEFSHRYCSGSSIITSQVLHNFGRDFSHHCSTWLMSSHFFAPTDDSSVFEGIFFGVYTVLWSIIYYSGWSRIRQQQFEEFWELSVNAFWLIYVLQDGPVLDSNNSKGVERFL